MTRARSSLVFASVLLAATPNAGSAQSAEPWSAPPSIVVATRSVTFVNAGATLHGTLYLPQTGHRVPAVVVLHGASEPLASTPLYRHLRDALPQLGIGVLLFDRRGTGASSGDTNVGYETLTADGIAGARMLRSLPTIDATRVGYWGISQGGWLATYAAVSDPAAAFAVAVSAPLVTAESQMEFAMANRLLVLGYSSDDVREMLTARKMVDGFFRGTNSRDEAVAALSAIERRPWFGLMYLPTSASLPHDPKSSAWVKQMELDPMTAVERVKIPILFLLGSADPWIPVDATISKLRGVAQTHPLLSYQVVPNANHLMMYPPQPERMNDADPKAVATETPQSPVYFTLLAAWLQRTLQLHGAFVEGTAP